jgi:metallo-beta-lactamase class B
LQYFNRILTLFIIALSLQQAMGQNSHAALVIKPLTDNFYVYRTYGQYKGAPLPVNAMYVVTDSSVVVFDTPWDTTQCQPLLDSIALRHHQRVILCIATHFHDDRTAGLGYFASRGISTYTTRLTDSLSKQHGNNRATHLLTDDTIFTIGQYRFQTFYPGAGHTQDNIVVWFDEQKILYGGCLIKGIDNPTLGYLGDADVRAYASTIRHVMQQCQHPKYVITGHDSWTSIRSLQHTYRLAKKLKRHSKI